MCTAALFFALPVPAAIVPEPAHTEAADGSFTLDASTSFSVPAGDLGARAAADYLHDLLHHYNALDLKMDSSGTRPVEFRRLPGLAAEGYRLRVEPGRVRIEASTDTGLFYGAVSLWQLLPPGAGGRIGAQRIDDAPRFAWRGLMLDSARHFQSADFVRRMVDWMALHKLNVLHWHLTDDQGWRLEMPKYPRLTSVGAWRSPGHYGGFYTQTQIREVVAYAAARHVRILPEVDLPGHATAAIAAYPSLGAGGTPLEVTERWGVFTHLLNLEPDTLQFLDDVLAEVIALFPSKDIHVGGDEVVRNEWQHSATVQARARALHLAPEDIQHYFTRHVGAFLAARGRRMVGWDEILTPDLAKDAIVMSWRGADGARLAALAGNDTVLSPAPQLYFDHRQSPLREEPPGRLAPMDLQSVYAFEPLDPGLDPEQGRHVLGLQANLWTEHVNSEARAEWMLWPRAAAIAEVGWSQTRDWDRFVRALPALFHRYQALGLNYADSVFGVDLQFVHADGGIEARLANLPGLAALGETSLRYTLDHTDPVATSAVYRPPLRVPPGRELRVATFLGPTRLSHVLTRQVDATAGVRLDSHDLAPCSEGVGLLLEPRDGPRAGPPLALDIMNPCWWQRGVDLNHGAHVSAAVVALPFNFELANDLVKLRLGDATTPAGELRIHADRCDAPPLAIMPFASPRPGSMLLERQKLPALAGRHDLCIDVARPAADPLWALDWIEIAE